MQQRYYMLLLAIGATFLALLLWDVYKVVQDIASMPKAEATLMSITNVYDDSGDLNFQFMTKENKMASFTINADNSYWTTGEKVKVLYDAANPSDAVVLTYGEAFRKAILFLWLGVPCLLIGAGYFASKRLLSQLTNEYYF